jgi:hypothetical protein
VTPPARRISRRWVLLRRGGRGAHPSLDTAVRTDAVEMLVRLIRADPPTPATLAKGQQDFRRDVYRALPLRR